MSKFNVLLYGPGAIGSFYAFILQRNENVRLTVVARSNYDAIKQNGILIESKNHGSHRFNPDAVVKSLAEVTEPVDYIVCAHKAIDQEGVAARLKPAIDDRTTIVLIQNGVGNETPFREVYPACSIITCVTWVGATQISPGVVEHSKSEDMQIGLYPNHLIEAFLEKNRLDTFASFLTTGGTKIQVLDDMQRLRWEKVVWNAAWNSVTALAMVDIGQWLDSSSEATSLSRRLMAEVIAVGRACGVALEDKLIDELIEKVQKIPRTNTSMQVDCMNGRPMEVDVILGYPARKGRELGVRTPILETLYLLVNAVDVRLRGGKL